MNPNDVSLPSPSRFDYGVDRANGRILVLRMIGYDVMMMNIRLGWKLA